MYLENIYIIYLFVSKLTFQFKAWIVNYIFGNVATFNILHYALKTLRIYMKEFMPVNYYLETLQLLIDCKHKTL